MLTKTEDECLPRANAALDTIHQEPNDRDKPFVNDKGITRPIEACYERGRQQKLLLRMNASESGIAICYIVSAKQFGLGTWDAYTANPAARMVSLVNGDAVPRSAPNAYTLHGRIRGIASQRRISGKAYTRFPETIVLLEGCYGEQTAMERWYSRSVLHKTYGKRVVDTLINSTLNSEGQPSIFLRSAMGPYRSTERPYASTESSHVDCAGLKDREAAFKPTCSDGRRGLVTLEQHQSVDLTVIGGSGCHVVAQRSRAESQHPGERTGAVSLTTLPSEVIFSILDHVLDAMTIKRGLQRRDSSRTGTYPAMLTVNRVLSEHTIAWFLSQELEIPLFPFSDYLGSDLPTTLLQRVKRVRLYLPIPQQYQAQRCTIERLAELWRDSNRLISVKVYRPLDLVKISSCETFDATYNDLLSLARPLLASMGQRVGITWHHDYTEYRWSGGYWALHWAAIFGNLDVARAILSHSPGGVNVTDSHGYTPLHEAVGQGDEKMTELLLAMSGVDAGIKTFYGQTALDLAVENGHTNIVKLFELARG